MSPMFYTIYLCNSKHARLVANGVATCVRAQIQALIGNLLRLRREDSTIKSLVVSQFTRFLTILETPFRYHSLSHKHARAGPPVNHVRKAIHHDVALCGLGSTASGLCDWTAP